MSIYKIILCYIFMIVCVNSAFSQLFYNNGATFYSNSGSVLYVDGSVENANSGTLENNGDIYITGDYTNNASTSGDGNYYLSGDWINNSVFNHGLSTVSLEGADQNISGTLSSTFNNLELTGSGIKYLQINTGVDGVLALNDRELSTGNYSMNINNTGTNAITRTTGFVSSSTNGYLSRATALTSTYLFPVGSSIGTTRYRPVEISPASNAANTYSVLMVNNDASSDGYDRTLLDTNTCSTLADFYHRINRISGSDAADISIYYDETADGLWDGIAHWETTPSNIWADVGTVNITSSTPLSNNTVTNWNNFSTEPYILSSLMPVVDLGPDTFVCDNSNITIDAGTSYDTYLWTGGSTTQTLNVTTNGTYYVTVTSNGCSAVDSIKVALYAAPVADAGENTSICAGETATLTGNGGTSYEWSTTETTQIIDVSPVTTTTFWVTVSDGYCYDDDSVIVTVLPIPVANAGSDQMICIGDSVHLTATGGSFFNWSTGQNTQSIDVQPTTTTDYYVTVTENGCSDIDTVTVDVVSGVNADAGTDQSICDGDDVTLIASGGGTYYWNTGSTNDSITVSPSSTTTYYVTVSAGSCSDKDSVTVNVNPVPTANAGNDTTICQGDYALLSASGGTNYSWSSGSSNQTTSVNPLTTTTYTVTVTENGCSDTDNITIYVNPTPNVNTSADQSICLGDSAILMATGAQNYVWSTSQTGNSIVVYPGASSSYYVTGTDANGCSDSDTIMVSVSPIPNAFAGQDALLCEGDTIQLTASGGDSYQWYPNQGLSDPNIINPLAFPQQDISYIVIVSNGICSDQDTVEIQVNSAPNIFAGNDTSIYSGDNTQLHATYNQNYIYQWTPTNYLSNPLIYNPLSTPDEDITYTIIVTDQNGCSASDNITITVEEKPAGDIVIYNTFTPNNDHINDYWIIENIEQYPNNVIKVYNRNGHKVFETDNYQNDWDGKYYGNDLPAATYYYIIDLGDGSDIYKGDITIIR